MNLSATIEIYAANHKLQKRLFYQGLPISIENRAGSVRRGTSKHWGPWQTKMKFDYGYVRGSKGMDGGGVDCFIGPNPNAKNAFVVHILKQPDFKSYDEDKVMLGWDTAAEAKKAFMAHYDSPKFFGGIETIPMAAFKRKVLETGKTGAKKIEAYSGEPGVYEGNYQHIDATPTFHPPSLKKAKRIPTDDPMEKDDSFLDVTKRGDKATKKFRLQQMKKHPTLGGVPPNTAVAHHTDWGGGSGPVI